MPQTPSPGSRRSSARLGFDPIAEARRQWEEHGWGDVAPAMAVVTAVMRVQQIFLAAADAALRPVGLTFARYEVLMLLSFTRRGELPLGKVGQRLQVKPASITNAVDRLEASGLVERVANPVDGRGVLACITPAGRTLAASATELMNRQVFADVPMDRTDLRALFDRLTPLRRAAGDFAEVPGERMATATGPAGARQLL